MKIVTQHIIILLFSLGLVSCDHQNEYPEEIEFCFEYLDENLDQQKIEEFKTSEWRPGHSHFGIGLFLRNNLLRNHDYSDDLVEYFNKNDIHHFDDMSGIILISYHKHLNNYNLELDKEFEKYRSFWDHFEKIDKSKDSIAIIRYNNFKIQDTLEIMTPLSRHSLYIAEKTFVLDWEYNDSTDLKIKGVIVDKTESENIDELEMKLKILEKSVPNAHYGPDTFNIDDTLNIPFKTTWIMRKK